MSSGCEVILCLMEQLKKRPAWRFRVHLTLLGVGFRAYCKVAVASFRSSSLVKVPVGNPRWKQFCKFKINFDKVVSILCKS